MKITTFLEIDKKAKQIDPSMFYIPVDPWNTKEEKKQKTN